MRKIDGWVITILERFCHKLQRLTGVRSAHLANAALMLAGFGFIWEMLSGHQHGVHWYAGCVILPSFFLMGLQATNRKQSFGSEATANPLKANTYDIYWRIAGLVLSGLTLPADWETKNFWFQMSVLGSYFAACDDLPVTPSKLKQWLISFKRQSELQPMEGEC